MYAHTLGKNELGNQTICHQHGTTLNTIYFVQPPPNPKAWEESQVFRDFQNIIKVGTLQISGEG